MEDMVQFIEEAIKDLDVFVEKRGDGGYIVVADKLRHLSKGKNIVTYWTTSCSVAVIILGLLPRKTFHSVDEMKEYKVAEKIRIKYHEMVG
jgi:hypothetical protein